jgi:lipopolysaccharide export system permease protein
VLRRFARYLLMETVGLYLFGLAAFILLLSIDLLVSFANFLIRNDATLAQIGQLFAFRLPFFLHISLPVAVVFGLLLATGRLAKDSELKAVYALGASPRRLLLPALVLGVAVAGISVLNNGYLEPRGERAYLELVNSFFSSRPSPETQSNVAYQLDNGIYFAGRVRGDLDDLTRAELSGVLVLQDGVMTSAPAGLWDSEARTWTLEGAEVVRGGGEPESVGSITLPFDIDTAPSETLARSDTLPLDELWGQIRELRAAGDAARPQLFALHRRIADAASAIIFALAAGALGLTVRSRSAGFGWTIVLLVVFYASWTLASNLFDRGVLDPVTAAWFTFALVGLITVVPLARGVGR